MLFKPSYFLLSILVMLCPEYNINKCYVSSMSKIKNFESISIIKIQSISLISSVVKILI